MRLQLDSRETRQPDVENEALRTRRSAAFQKGFRRFEHLGHESVRIQNALDGLAHCGVVVDNRDGVFRWVGHDER